jgi:hypothetical protein
MVVLLDNVDQRSSTNEDMVGKAGGEFFYNSTQLSIWGNVGSALTVDVSSARCLAYGHENGNAPDFYVDGAYAGVGAASVTTMFGGSTNFGIGNYISGSFPTTSPILAVLIIDGKLSATEQAQACTELRYMRWPRRKSGTGQGSYGAELLTNGDIETGDTTGWTGFHNPTLTTPAGRAMAGDYVVRIAYTDENYPAIYQSVGSAASTRFTGDARGDGTCYPYVTGDETMWSGTTSTAWQHFDVVNTASGTLLLYNSCAGAGWVEFDNVSAKAVQGNWIQYKTGYGATAGNTNFTAGQVENTDFIRSTGTWKVTTDTVNGKTAKVLECVAAGIAYVDARLLQGSPTLDAYGTWEWWFYRGSTGNDLRVGFIADAVAAQPGYNGYEITMSGAERIYLYEMNGAAAGTKCRTDDAAFVQQTWYQLRITRSGAGEFSLYLDGTLVDMTGGSGTNPTTDATYTTSNYILLEFDAGDKISLGSTDGDENLFKLQGVVAP